MIKNLMKSIREYKKPSLLSPLFVALDVVLECLIPFITSGLVNYFNGTNAPDGSTQHVFSLFNYSITTVSDMQISHVLIYAALLIAIASLALTCGVLAGRFSAMAAAGFAKNLRKDIYYNIQGFSFENIDKYSTSSLVTRLTTDITNIQNAYMMIIRAAVRAPLMFTFCLCISFSINWALTLIFVAAVPILLGVLLFIMLKAMPVFRRVFKKYDKMNLRVQENLHGVRVVKSYVREDYEIEKFETASEDIRKDFTRAEKMMAVISPVMSFVIYGLMIALCACGSFIIVNSNGGDFTFGSLDTGTLTSLMSYSLMSIMALMILAMVLVMVSMAIESGRRVSEVITERSTLISHENGAKEMKDGSIQFENVDFLYRSTSDVMALEGVNISIKSGETVGVIGATGSAKTTLAQLLPRLYDATRGVVRVGGRDVKEYDLEFLRKNVAMVLQKNVLFSGTIKENLKWGNPDATDEQIVAACKAAQAHDFIEQFPKKYDTFIEQSGTNVSGGQRQRLCIARALLTDPKVLIFDDSTSAVDTKTDARLRAALKKALPDVTKLIIAQRIDSVKDSDMIIVLDSGKVNAVGTHGELLKNNIIYQEVFYSQTNSKKEAV